MFTSISQQESKVATHVDDFLVVGYENVLKDFYKALLKEFELKCTLIGGGKQHQRSGLYLGRTITWTEDGYTWEPDEKHAQISIRTLGLEQCHSVLPRIQGHVAGG